MPSPLFFVSQPLLTRVKTVRPQGQGLCAPCTCPYAHHPKETVAAVAAAAAVAAILLGGPALALNGTPQIESELRLQELVFPTPVAPDCTLLADADASSRRGFPEAGESKAEARAAKDRSRRNSRISGNAAQIFTNARREAATGNLTAALSSYDSLVDAAPTFAPGHSNRANILVAQGKLRDALPEYTAALDLAPLEPDVWVIYVNRGCVYRDLGDLQSALEDFSLSLASGGGDVSAIYSNRATVYERLEKWDMALRDYQRAIESKANDVQPWWIRYAMVLYERDRSVESLGILRRVAARYEASDVHAAMAGILFSRGEVVEAEGQWSMVDRPSSFSNVKFLRDDRMWTPRMVKAMGEFSTNRANIRAKAAVKAAKSTGMTETD